MAVNEEFDTDKDGIIEKEDIDIMKEVKQEQRTDRKMRNQRRMAWAAMATMIIFTAIILSPLVTDTRVEVLSALLSTFYVAQAGVVGAYMGFSVMQDRNRNEDKEDNY